MTDAPREERTYVIYDGRTAGGLSPDDASVYCTADTLSEAKQDVRSMFPDGEIFEYVVVGNELTQERWIPRNYDAKTPKWFE